MKRLFMLLCAVVAFAACEQAPIKEMQGAAINERNLEVSFEGGDDTRIQLQNGKTVWTESDHVSVFYRSTVNEEWQFDGKTGDRIGNIVPVDNTLNPPATHNRVVVIYPYNNEYYLNTETYSIEASLPAVQTYLEDSYGTNGNIMVSSGDYKQVSLKSVCGWLKLQLTGDGEVVKSITLKGNNGEQVAGELHINTSDATCVLASASGDAGESEVGGTLVRPGTILTEVTLDCGEGVALGKEATAFYIALPPQTFEKGFTVDIECDGYKPMTLSTTNTLTIKRNHIQPMAGVEHNAIPVVPNNQIWYTSSDDDVVTPYNTKVFGANIISNTYNNGKGVITFDGDVTTIGEDAFYNCDSLTSVTIGNGVTEIVDFAFYSCDSLTSVNIPDSVTTIGDYAFAYCYYLTSVNIPDSVTTIGTSAFDGCGSLTSVNIPNSVTTIGNAAFAGCTSLTSVNIPDSVTTIGEKAFSGCTSLTSVNIPDSVTTIGYAAFAGCTSLTSVNIPDSVTTIGDAAFNDCDSLKEFKGKFATEDGRSLIVDNTIIAYANASGTTYNIPDSVTSIGDAAFNDCDSLTSVNIPDSVTTIGDAAFRFCDSLTSVNIPDSVTTIGNFAFGDCNSLTSVNIPDSVTTIGYGAFYYCTSLTSVYCKATTPPALGYSYVFYNNGSGRKISVPVGSVNAYKSAEYWSEYADAIVGYDFENGMVVSTPQNNEIWYTSSDGNVVTPNKTNVFGANISSNTYSNGKGVITFDGDVTTIGNYAFEHCESLTSVNIPDSVTTIGEHAFFYCESLTSVNIPNSVTMIGDYAFAYSDSFTSVTIGDSVTMIGNFTFFSCYNLTSVTIGDSVTKIGDYAFSSCESLTSVTIPDSVTTIGDRAFFSCKSLTSVNIPDSVTTIGNYAFAYCTSLYSVILEATTPPALGGPDVFDNNGSGRKIYVPAGSTSAYKSAANWSEYADVILGYDSKGMIVE